MLLPYIPSTYTYEFNSLMEEVATSREFIAVKLTEVLSIIVEHGAQAQADAGVKADIESRLRALAESYLEMSEQQIRVKDIANRAAAAGESIHGYSPDIIIARAEESLAGILDAREALTADIDYAHSARREIYALDAISKATGILGDAVGPVADALEVYQNLVSNDAYAAAGSALSGYLGLAAAAFEKLVLSTFGWQGVVIYTVASGLLTGAAGKALEGVLDEGDILDINELSPNENDDEGKRRLLSAVELIASIDPNISLSEVARILGSSSGQFGERIDAFIGFVKSYFDGGEPFPNADTLAASIRQFSFEQSIGAFGLISLPDRSFDEIANLAKFESGAGRSTRYALENLVPFATEEVVGTSAAQDKYELSNFTDSYIDDKSLFLAGYLEGLRLNNDNQLNVDGGINVLVEHVGSDFSWYGFDAKKSVQVSNLSLASEYDLAMYFGGDAGESVDWSSGTMGSDHLYGGGGNDTLRAGGKDDYLQGDSGSDFLYGGKGNDILLGMADNDYLDGEADSDILDGGIGNDTLVGGGGDDQLKGGVGKDRYEFSTGDGDDLVVDSDGQGSIWLDGVRLSGGKEIQEGAGVWRSDDSSTVYYIVTNPDQTQSLYIQHGDDLIRVQQYIPGQLGIVLSGSDDPQPAPNTDLTIVGDKKPIDFDPSLPGVQYGYDALGNELTTDEIEVRGDGLYGGAGNDLIQGLGGNDGISGRAGNDRLEGGVGGDVLNGNEGNDTLDGGDGSDRLEGHTENDLLIGGEGSDILEGNSGDDWLYATAQVSIESIRQQAQGSGLRGDWITGGLGRDVVVGDSGNDVLFGGGGQDTVYGGAGDDVINGDDSYRIYTFNWRVTYDGNPFDRTWHSVWIEDYSPDVGESDFLYGGAGNDWISGLQGNDWLFGEEGQDTLSGHDGNDLLFGGSGDDLLTGDYGKYLADSGSGEIMQGNDTLDGGDGNDSLQGESGDDLLIGGEGNDTLLGDADYLDGEDHGRDRLEGGVGSDQLAGYGENDYLEGGDGADVLVGDHYESVLAGQFHGQDTLLGGAGVDTLFGGGGGDQLRGGSEADQLVGDSSVSQLSAIFHGDDTLYGDGGNDSLWGDGGDDLIFGGSDNDVLAGDASDLAEIDQGNDTLHGEAGDDELYGGSGNDLLEGGSGLDYLEGGNGSDVYRFSRGWGEDWIENYNSSAGDTDLIEFTDILSSQIEVVRYGYSLLLTLKGTTDIVTVSDYFMNEAASNYSLQIRFADGEKWTVEHVKNLVLQGTDQNDFLTGYSSNDVLAGGLGDDVLSGLDGSDNISGGSGNDTLKGQAGNDLLEGGIGNDLLSGGLDSDTYRFSRGWGQDTVDNYDSSTNKLDVIEFAGDISSNEIRTARASNGKDLVLALNGTSDKVTVKDYFLSSAVEEIRFANGAVWTEENVRASLFSSTDGADTINGSGFSDLIQGGLGNDVIYGGVDNDSLFGGAGNDRLEGGSEQDWLYGQDGNDNLYGDAGNDTLEGGAGNDNLLAGEGSDTYRFSRGWGQDWISNADAGTNKIDVIEFAADILPGDILATSSQQNLVLSLKGTSDRVTVGYYFEEDGHISFALEEIRFADGTVWTLDQVRLMVASSSDGNDDLTGYGTADTLSGGKGDDRLYAQAGDDLLSGDEGEDHLYGEEGNDTLDGGLNNDRLDGGLGSDVYLFGRGSGQDTISGWDDTVGKRDVIKLGADVLPSEIVLAIRGHDLVLAISGSDDYLVVMNHFLESVGSREGIEAVEFSDGTVWEIANINALQKLTAVIGGAGTQYLYGGESSEFLGGGSGDDYLNAGAGNDYLSGGEGMDTLNGGGGDDTLSGGAGNDYLSGNYGDDTYYFGRGSGNDRVIDEGEYNYSENDAAVLIEKQDVIVFESGINKDDIEIGHDGRDLLLTIRDTGETLRVWHYFWISSDGTNPYSVKEIKFQDGSSWSFEDILSQLVPTDGNDYLLGTDGSNYLQGLVGHDELFGGVGNDTLDGGAGDDWLRGGLGNDTFVFGRGYGLDVISSSIASWDNTPGKLDVVRFADDITPDDIEISRSWFDLYLTIRDTGDQLRIEGYFTDEVDGPRIIQDIQFADGTTWNFESVFARVVPTQGDDFLSGLAGDDLMQSLAGNDYLFGQGGDDTLDGGAGDDYLDGGAGNDLYLFAPGSGNDTIAASWDEGSVQHDVLRFADGIELADITAKREWQDLLLTIGDSGDQLRIEGYFPDESPESVNPQSIELIQFADGSILDAATLDALLASPSGTNDDDGLFGSSGADLIQGLDGDDEIHGLAGNDTLDGGVGDDDLYGGLGDDVYLFGRGSGDDCIYWQDVDQSGDKVLFASDISEDDIEVSRDWYALQLTISDTGESLWIDNYFADPDGTGRTGLGLIQFASGQIWDLAAVESRLSPITPSEDDDQLFGTSASEQVQGLGGDDLIDSGAGNDTIIGGAGEDRLRGGGGNDLYIVTAAADHASWGEVEDTSGVDELRFASVTAGETLVLGEEDYGLERVVIGTGTAAAAVMSGTSALNVDASAVLNGMSITGNAGANSLQGTAFDDVLDGGAGNDSLIGGTGSDTYVVNTASDVVTEAADAGVDSILSSVTLTLGSNVENLTLTGTTALSGTGNALDNHLKGNSAANTLTGGSGNDRLDGAAGNDTLNGGIGDDSYVVDSASDVVTENANEGTDTVESSVTVTLSNNVERLVLTGSAALNGAGNALANELIGNSGNNRLDGGAGADTLSGGIGNDSYVVDNVLDLIVERSGEGADSVESSISYVLGAELENLVLTGSGSNNGSGNSLNNSLTGNSGANRLDGGLGADTMIGGAGNDTYVVDDVGDSVSETSSSGGTDTVESAVSWTLGNNLEHLTLTGIANANATGNSLANTLRGNVGNNRLNGGTGNDTMIGGLGDDTYVVDSTSDVVTESVGEGTDLIESSVTLTLGSNIENLTLTGTSTLGGTGNTLNNILIGNSAANTLTGGGGNDRLDGGSGNDTMRGGVGDDTYVVNTTSDVVTENTNEGIDTVESSVTLTLGNNLENLTLTGTGALNGTGNTLNNILTGNAGVNSLTGAAGNDRLDGQGGADTLTGGTGHDTYVLGRGYGADTAVENDATAGNTDIAQFLSGISTDQLWFRKLSNNLEVSIIGTSDKLTVKDWYLGNAYHVEQFKTADGKTLLDSQVQNLVNAMAAFAPPAAGQTSLPENYQASLASVIAANWQ